MSFALMRTACGLGPAALRGGHTIVCGGELRVCGGEGRDALAESRRPLHRFLHRRFKAHKTGHYRGLDAIVTATFGAALA